MLERDKFGKFLPSYVSDPFDPRGWDEDLPYRPIYLTKGMHCVVDVEDYEWAIQWLWFCTRDLYTTGYAARSVGAGGKDKLIWLHKEVLKRFSIPPSPKHFIGDHKNGNRLDNRRRNLRWATLDENNRNRHGFYMKQMELGL